MGFGFGFGGFSIFGILFGLVFVTFLVFFIVMAVKGISQWNKNNHSPKLTVNATVVTKRMSVSHHSGHNDANGMHHSGSSSTSYYATFQVESGDRMELNVGGMEYGMLVEGDHGSLTFQGTRYLSFTRN